HGEPARDEFVGRASGDHPSPEMGRSAGKLAVPSITPELQAHQAHGARARRSRKRRGRAAVGSLGSARVSRAGDGVSPSRTFLAFCDCPDLASRKACFGATPKPTRETRALPGNIRDIRACRAV